MKFNQTYIINFFFCSLPLLCWVVVRYILGFNGLYGQDAHEYFRFSKAIHSFFILGVNPGDYFWPVNYPLYGALIALLGLDVDFSLQFLSSCSLVLTGFFSYKVLRLLNPESEEGEIKLFLIAFLFLSPFILRSSFYIMSDTFSCMLITGGLYFVLKSFKDLKASSLVLACFFISSAIMTRYPAGVILIIPVVFVTIKYLRNLKIPALLICFIVAGFVFAPHFFLKSEKSLSFMNHEFLNNWDVLNLFRSDFENAGGGFQSNKFINLIYILFPFCHIGYFISGLAFSPFIKIRDYFKGLNLILFLSLVVYLIFLGGIGYQNDRYFILCYPIVVILAFPAYERFSLFLKSWKYIFLTAVILMQLVLQPIALKNTFKLNQFELTLAKKLDQQERNKLYIFALDVSLRSYDTKHELLNLWDKEYISFQDEALLLFNYEKFKNQWKDQNPMINWNKINDQANLLQLDSLGNGWTLYQINLKDQK